MSDKSIEQLEAEYRKAEYEFEALQEKYGAFEPEVQAAYCDMEEARKKLIAAENSQAKEGVASSSSSSSYKDSYDDDVWTEAIDNAFSYTCDNSDASADCMSVWVEDWEQEVCRAPESDDLFCAGEPYSPVRVPCGPQTVIRIPGYNETESLSGQRLLSPAQVKKAIAFNQEKHSPLLNGMEIALHLPTRDRSQSGEYTELLVQRIARLQQDAYTRQSQNTAVRDRLVCPRVDGKLDDATMAYINRYCFGKDTKEGQINTAKIWPDVDWLEDKKFDHYNDICKQFGHEVKSDGVTLLGIRGVMLFAVRSRARIGDHARAYDDSFILLDYREGNKKVREFSGATHAYQVSYSKGPNVDPDTDAQNRPDVGSIRDNDGKSLYRITFAKKKG